MRCNKPSALAEKNLHQPELLFYKTHKDIEEVQATSHVICKCNS